MGGVAIRTWATSAGVIINSFAEFACGVDWIGMMNDVSEQEISVDEGYENLARRVTNDLKALQVVAVEPGSAIAAEDALFGPEPLYRSFELCTKQPLGNALDHLQLVAETFNDRGEPHPYAEATLIRTAITAASYSLWMLMPDGTTERRRRALAFLCKDCDGAIGIRRSERVFPGATDEEIQRADEIINGMEERRRWIVDQANSLTGDSLTVKQYRQKLPADSKVVGDAGPRILCTWQFLGGYAHGLPWATLGNQVPRSDPHPETGMVTMAQRGNPKELLNAAFSTLEVIERATDRYRIMCAQPSA